MLKIEDMGIKKIILVFIGLLISISLSGCSLNKQNGAVSSSPSSTPSFSTPAENAQNIVSIENFSFNPSVITVTKGTKVTWVNKDSTVHTITSPSFTSGNLNTGDKFEFVFADAGTFDYTCGIHPSMKGKVEVK